MGQHIVKLRDGKAKPETVTTEQLKTLHENIVGFAANYEVQDVGNEPKPATLPKEPVAAASEKHK